MKGIKTAVKTDWKNYAIGNSRGPIRIDKRNVFFKGFAKGETFYLSYHVRWKGGMKGISTKIVTDEETVRMHTNFAEFKNVSVNMAYPDIATWNKGDCVLKVHVNTIHGWGLQVRCGIRKSLLKAGQKYGISLRSTEKYISTLSLMTGDSAHNSIEIVKPHWDGDKLSAVVMLKDADIVDGIGINSYLYGNNVDYEFRDFRIWEIDDLGGGEKK